MTVGAIIVLLILITSIVCHKLFGRRRQSAHEEECDCGCHSQMDNLQIALRGEESELPQRGLYELEQDTKSRGLKPKENQPNHVSNKWKCEYSHPSLDCLGRQETSFYSDMPTPIRRRVVQNDVDNISKIHMSSRFNGAECS